MEIISSCVIYFWRNFVLSLTLSYAVFPQREIKGRCQNVKKCCIIIIIIFITIIIIFVLNARLKPLYKCTVW